MITEEMNIVSEYKKGMFFCMIKNKLYMQCENCVYVDYSENVIIFGNYFMKIFEFWFDSKKNSSIMNTKSKMNTKQKLYTPVSRETGSGLSDSEVGTSGFY